MEGCQLVWCVSPAESLPLRPDPQMHLLIYGICTHLSGEKACASGGEWQLKSLKSQSWLKTKLKNWKMEGYVETWFKRQEWETQVAANWLDTLQQQANLDAKGLAKKEAFACWRKDSQEGLNLAFPSREVPEPRSIHCDPCRAFICELWVIGPCEDLCVHLPSRQSGLSAWISAANGAREDDLADQLLCRCAST